MSLYMRTIIVHDETGQRSKRRSVWGRYTASWTIADSFPESYRQRLLGKNACDQECCVACWSSGKRTDRQNIWDGKEMEKRHVTTRENKWSRHGAVVTLNRIKNVRRSPLTPSRFVSANEVIRTAWIPVSALNSVRNILLHSAKETLQIYIHVWCKRKID